MGSRLEKNSNLVRKRIENHTFDDEQGEEYEGSKFGGFSDYMRRKKIKLQNLDAELRSQSGDKPQIFRGIVAWVNGYTQPSLNDLHQLIVSHGGGFLQYLDGKTACTHIIASQLTPKKKAEFAKYRIVKPAWVVDSVDAGRLLPWDAYRLVDEGVAQKIIGFENGQVVSQANRAKQSYRDQTDTSWYTSQFKASRPEPSDPVSGKDASKGSAEDGLDRATPSLLLPDGFVDEYENSEEPDGTDLDVRGRSTNDPTSLELMTSDLPESASLKETRTDGDRDNESLVNETSDGTSIIHRKQAEKRKLTAEEHNAILLSNPHMAKSSTANPDFLNQYYRESRLHHLSAWKADLKSQLQARAMAKSSSQKPLTKRKPGTRRYVMHVDFDSFFAAVSLRKNQHLIDQPVVVAHGSGPGSEIASCNYPARKYGVKNGMWMKYALELCPKLKVLPYDFKAYEEASRHFYDAILAMDGVVQSISIDEALIDVSLQCIRAGGSDGEAAVEEAILKEQKKADELAGGLRIAIKNKTGCDVSIGIGGNILLAKVALRKAKPAGQHQVLPEAILDFVGELEVTNLPGVAHSLGKKLEEIGVKLVKDIRNLTKERLASALGPKTGEKLWDYARGIDKVEVGDQVVRKSVSAEINWGIRFITQQQAEDFVQALCDELQKRLLENGVKGKQMTMKIMRKAADAGMDPPKNLGHGKCDTFNKSVILGVATTDAKVLGKEAISILRSYGFSPGELRGLGVQMQRLEALKPAGSVDTGIMDGSQRRLNFMKPSTKPSTEETEFRQSVDEKPKVLPTVNATSGAHVESIEDFESPHKAQPETRIASAVVNTNQESDRPLNMFGTQFVLPSQVDPAVLAELPDDIRSKLAPKAIAKKQATLHAISLDTTTNSRSNSPYRSDNDYELPRQSQLDPETLAALPEEVKEELLSHYRTLGKQRSADQNQSLLPQSPRKARPIYKKAIVTPTKKLRPPLLNRAQLRGKNSSASTLTQSNFLAVSRGREKGVEEAPVYDEDIPQSFLDELPDDIRSEIVEEQRRSRMKIKSGLNVGTSRKKPRAENAKDTLLSGQQLLQLPHRPEAPTFTSRKLTKLSDLHEAMSAWVQEFSDDGEQGPFEEDVSALGTFLSRVIKEEGDMAKATSVINWLSYLINDWPFASETIRRSWHNASWRLKKTVQDAVKERGLPPIVFSET